MSIILYNELTFRSFLVGFLNFWPYLILFFLLTSFAWICLNLQFMEDHMQPVGASSNHLNNMQEQKNNLKN